MRLHKTEKYKNYVILIYQLDGYYQSIICDNSNNCNKLIAMYLTEYEALSLAKRRIDVS